MDKKMLFAVLSLVFFAGCTGPVCNKPYIQMGSGCCLDRNDNGICDTDDTTTTTAAPTTLPPIRVPEYISTQCSGKLLVVYADKVWLYTGETARITASFKNDGNISGLPVVFRMRAVLDNTTDSILQSEEIVANAGETVNVTTEVVPSNPGRYLIIGTVDYCEKRTEERSTILNVRDIREKPTEEMPAANGTEKKKWTISRST